MVDKNSSIFIACRPTGIIAILFCIVFCLLVMPASALTDNFNDGEIVSDWNVVSGSWTVINTSSIDGADDYYVVNTISEGSVIHVTDNSIYRLISGVSYYEVDMKSSWGSMSGSTYTESKFSFESNGTNRNSIFIYNAGSVRAEGFTYSNVAISEDTWYHFEIFTQGCNIRVEIFDMVGNLINSQTSTYTPVESRDRIELTNYLYNHLQVSTITSRFDNVLALASDPSAPPPVHVVSWNQDLYYTGETAIIQTNIDNFDAGTYSYYLDLYNTNDYLTTFELTSGTEFNYYTFPLGWTDTSLLAKLVRVTDPYATNEVQLAYDISHFETLDWDTTVSFNKSSYNPSETLKVTWSGAADGSDVWLRAGDDGEVIESDVAYSGSFTFNIPANTTETYYIVDVATGGYSQAQASCIISSVPDFFFNYSVAVDQDEYVHGDWVNVTYSTNEPAVIKVFDDTNADIWHYLDVPAAVTNETWMYYIGDTDPYGSFSVLFGNDNFLVSDYYSVVSSTSFVQVVPESMYMYETMRIWYITNGSSTLSVTDSSDSILLQQTVNSSSLESISYIPTVSGILTITLSDVPADATDSIIVYWADDPDDVPDEDDIEEDVIEDVLGDDETMTEYYNEKFRDFAPTIWGFFMLMCLLFLMSILTSFNSGDKRR